MAQALEIAHRAVNKIHGAAEVAAKVAVGALSCLAHGESPTPQNLYQDAILRLFGLRWTPGRLLFVLPLGVLLLLMGCFPMPAGPVTEAAPLASDHGAPTWACVVYESEGQIGATTRTRSGMPHETVLVEVLGAKMVSCSETSAAPEPHCRRVPAGDLRKAGNGNAWLLLRSAGVCPGRAG